MRVLAAASSLSQSLPIILMVALFGGLIYFQMRSRKRMQAQQAAMRSDIAVGTRVVLISGMKATVVRMRPDEVDLEIAPGVVATFDQKAIARQDTLATDHLPGDDIIESDPVRERPNPDDESDPGSREH